MLHHKSRTSIIASEFSGPLPVENNFMQSDENLSTSSFDQNLFCIWYHDDDISENVQNAMNNRLNELFTHVRIFNDPHEFAAYLICPLVRKIFFIITSKLAECLCVIATKRPQCEKVYRFETNSSADNNSLFFTNIDQLFVTISEDIKVYLDKNQSPSKTELSTSGSRRVISLPPWSVWNSKKTEHSFRYWKKESPEFFLFQTLTRILTQMKCDHNQSLKEMIAECRSYYFNDTIEVQKIDEVEDTYKANDAIWHYTRDSFLFRLIGRAFRSEDFEHVFKFRRYIFDLHQELDRLINKQETQQNALRLYRGKKLPITVLQQLYDNRRSLISMNGFLSTTLNRETALKIFAGAGQNRPNQPYHESVLFEFCIDETAIKRTYAAISAISQYPEEEEVLFTIGSIWRIDSVEKYNDLYWIVQLSSCNDISLKIVQFYEQITDDSTFLMLGDVLRELGQNTKAERFYHKMLEDPNIEDDTRLTLYYNIAMINMEQEKYPAALEYLHKAKDLIPSITINRNILAFQSLYSYSDVPSSIHIFNNMGFLYQKIDESDNALKYFNDALNIETSDKIDKATVYDNIGLLYYTKGDYDIAVEYLSKAVKLAQDDSSLPRFKQHYDVVNQHLLSKKNKSLDKKLNGSI